MKMPNKEELAILRETYRPGTIIELTADMEDPYHPLPAGLQGEVTGVDDAGSIQTNWSNGSTLAIIPEVDHFKIVHQPVMTETVKKQILSLRLHPEAPNMFSVYEVQALAYRLEYYELVNFILDHKKEYCHFILTGKML